MKHKNLSKKLTNQLSKPVTISDGLTRPSYFFVSKFNG